MVGAWLRMRRGKVLSFVPQCCPTDGNFTRGSAFGSLRTSKEGGETRDILLLTWDILLVFWSRITHHVSLPRWYIQHTTRWSIVYQQRVSSNYSLFTTIHQLPIAQFPRERAPTWYQGGARARDRHAKHHSGWPRCGSDLRPSLLHAVPPAPHVAQRPGGWVGPVPAHRLRPLLFPRARTGANKVR